MVPILIKVSWPTTIYLVGFQANNPIYKSKHGVYPSVRICVTWHYKQTHDVLRFNYLCVCLFLFFSFISHVLGKKGPFTRVTTYNRSSIFSFSFHLFHTFWGKNDCLQGWPRTMPGHPPPPWIDRLLLTRSSLFFFFCFFSFSFIYLNSHHRIRSLVFFFFFF